ncbi:MAG: DNA mismatch repair protein MutS [Candidatus Lokiarchaeota archaeon]
MNSIESLEDLDPKKATPMIKHWISIKKKYPEYLVAYRMGDFYEFFYDDAIRVSNLIGITLTKRKIGDDEYPLAGIPHHSGNYLNNLVKKGQTVVIVEQLEDPSKVKGRIVKRGVVRILSPGTVTEADMLRSEENNYIASIIKERRGYGCAFADISTGEFVTTEFSLKESDAFEKLLSMFSRFDPAELIVPSELHREEKLFIFLNDISNALIKEYDDFYFSYDEASQLIKRHFEVSNLDGFGLQDSDLAIQAAGGLLAFLKETQRDIIPNIFKIKKLKEMGVLHLDYITQRNLELTSSLWEKGKDTTLFSVFNRTETPMGTRLLKKYILEPLTEIKEINHRLNIVQKFKDDIFLRSDLKEQLKIIGDLERYINRINYTSRSNARDLINIKNSLEKIPKIRNLLRKTNIPEIEIYLKRIDEFSQTREIINSNYKKLLSLTSGLKVGHNNILGYYIQITKKTLQSINRIPQEYVERQTLKNSRRYTTRKLKELEEKIVTAQEKINDLEYGIFCQVREKVEEKTIEILETAENIAIIDVLSCFAEISEKYNYSRPEVNNSKRIEIKQGRHPVIEQINITDKFIPNDCYLDTEKEQILIITGPNMSGKSTYLRQVALICLIAQMGCFVPARYAKVGIIDQIFTRIGASDDLARKLSTFMIEMTETAKILNYATEKSLVIIDELGRGTSTSDGQSIAMATLEKLHDINAKTLFSTHYHQLTEIELPRVKNYHLDIIENDDGTINFVRTLKSGSTEKSYGIHIAKLAGIPDDVIIRAFEILEQIEENDPFKETVKNNGNSKNSSKFHEKLIAEKEQSLKNLNKKLEKTREQIITSNDQIREKSITVKECEAKIELLKEKIKKLSQKTIKGEQKPQKQKKSIQTTFFQPIIKKERILDEEIKDIIKVIKEMDINSTTPVNAMKILIELHEKAIKLDKS